MVNVRIFRFTKKGTYYVSWFAIKMTEEGFLSIFIQTEKLVKNY